MQTKGKGAAGVMRHRVVLCVLLLLPATVLLAAAVGWVRNFGGGRQGANTVVAWDGDVGTVDVGETVQVVVRVKNVGGVPVEVVGADGF